MRIFLLALDEARRVLLSRRGLLSVLAFALAWALVLVYVVRPAGLLDVQGVDGHAGGGAGGLVRVVAERFGFEALLDWPSAQLAAGWVVALYLLPVVALSVAVDQIASDRARGTLRYLALRASRTEIVLGRWLGQSLVQAALVVASLGSTLALVALDVPGVLADALAGAPAVALALWFTLLPWTALASCVSVLAPSARRATLLAFGLWIGLSWLTAFATSRLAGASGLPDGVRDVSGAVIEHLVPGAVTAALLDASPSGTPFAAAPALVQTALFLAAAVLAFRRRAL